jgi:hypothetical protein
MAYRTAACIDLDVEVPIAPFKDLTKMQPGEPDEDMNGYG